MEYLIAESIITENINSPSFPHEYELIINNWENVKIVWGNKNNDYYKSSAFKNCHEWHDCNMNGFFKIWEK